MQIPEIITESNVLTEKPAGLLSQGAKRVGSVAAGVLGMGDLANYIKGSADRGALANKLAKGFYRYIGQLYGGTPGGMSAAVSRATFDDLRTYLNSINYHHGSVPPGSNASIGDKKQIDKLFLKITGGGGQGGGHSGGYGGSGSSRGTGNNNIEHYIKEFKWEYLVDKGIRFRDATHKNLADFIEKQGFTKPTIQHPDELIRNDAVLEKKLREIIGPELAAGGPKPSAGRNRAQDEEELIDDPEPSSEKPRNPPPGRNRQPPRPDRNPPENQEDEKPADDSQEPADEDSGPEPLPDDDFSLEIEDDPKPRSRKPERFKSKGITASEFIHEYLPDQDIKQGAASYDDLADYIESKGFTRPEEDWWKTPDRFSQHREPLLAVTRAISAYRSKLPRPSKESPPEESPEDQNPTDQSSDQSKPSHEPMARTADGQIDANEFKNWYLKTNKILPADASFSDLADYIENKGLQKPPAGWHKTPDKFSEYSKPYAEIVKAISDYRKITQSSGDSPEKSGIGGAIDSVDTDIKSKDTETPNDNPGVKPSAKSKKRKTSSFVSEQGLSTQEFVEYLGTKNISKRDATFGDLADYVESKGLERPPATWKKNPDQISAHNTATVYNYFRTYDKWVKEQSKIQYTGEISIKNFKKYLEDRDISQKNASYNDLERYILASGGTKPPDNWKKSPAKFSEYQSPVNELTSALAKYQQFRDKTTKKPSKINRNRKSGLNFDGKITLENFKKYLTDNGIRHRDSDYSDLGNFIKSQGRPDPGWDENFDSFRNYDDMTSAIAEYFNKLKDDPSVQDDSEKYVGPVSIANFKKFLAGEDIPHKLATYDDLENFIVASGNQKPPPNWSRQPAKFSDHESPIDELVSAIARYHRFRDNNPLYKKIKKPRTLGN